jgi:MFS family permease
MNAQSRDTRKGLRLPNEVVLLGLVSFLSAMSTAMIHGVLPVFLVTALGAGMASVGLIEGLAEGANSFAKIGSGIVSDWFRRRKPIVAVGYAISAAVKLLFPVAGSVSTVLLARVTDRLGKGIRDAPRDAFMADLTPVALRGSGFGLRLSFYTAGFVLGPLTAIALMRMSAGDFRLVFWIALIPAFFGIAVLLFCVKESHLAHGITKIRPALSNLHWRRFPPAFWWTIAIATSLSLARFSHAFLVLKAHHAGMDAALVPMIFVFIYLVYSSTAYPLGVLADRFNRRIQLAAGIIILVAAQLVLASSASLWLTFFGAGLWGLQMAVTQGLLSAEVADAAPADLRATAFGLFEMSVGLATFSASAIAGALWAIGGPVVTFAAGAAFAAVAGALVIITLRPRQAQLG